MDAEVGILIDHGFDVDRAVELVGIFGSAEEAVRHLSRQDEQESVQESHGDSLHSRVEELIQSSSDLDWRATDIAACNDPELSDTIVRMGVSFLSQSLEQNRQKYGDRGEKPDDSFQSEGEKEKNIKAIAELGFQRTVAVQALKRSGGNVDAAIESLLT